MKRIGSKSLHDLCKINRKKFSLIRFVLVAFFSPFINFNHHKSNQTPVDLHYRSRRIFGAISSTQLDKQTQHLCSFN